MPHIPETAKQLINTDRNQVDKPVNRLDPAQIIKLRFKNKLTFNEIAKIYNVTDGAVCKRIKSIMKLISDPDLDKAYADNRVELMTSAERILLSYLVHSDKLKDASLNNTAYALKQVHDMRRLNADLSTGNQAIKIEVVKFTRELKVEGNIGDG
jgi:predicted DNA-binding protein YlxM (UPF0122 family)